MFIVCLFNATANILAAKYYREKIISRVFWCNFGNHNQEKSKINTFLNKFSSQLHLGTYETWLEAKFHNTLNYDYHHLALKLGFKPSFTKVEGYVLIIRIILHNITCSIHIYLLKWINIIDMLENIVHKDLPCMIILNKNTNLKKLVQDKM